MFILYPLTFIPMKKKFQKNNRIFIKIHLLRRDNVFRLNAIKIKNLKFGFGEFFFEFKKFQTTSALRIY